MSGEKYCQLKKTHKHFLWKTTQGMWLEEFFIKSEIWDYNVKWQAQPKKFRESCSEFWGRGKDCLKASKYPPKFTNTVKAGRAYKFGLN